MYQLVPLARLVEWVGSDIDVQVGAKRVVLSLTHPPDPAEEPALGGIKVEVVLDRRGPLAGFDPGRPRFRVGAGGRPVSQGGDVPDGMSYYAEEARLLLEAVVEMVTETAPSGSTCGVAVP